MDRTPIKYAVLRDRQEWAGVATVGLSAEADGALALTCLPAPADGVPIRLSPPYKVDLPCGLAVAGCDDIYLALPTNNQVAQDDGISKLRTLLPGQGGGGSAPGQFNAPRAVLVGPPGGLYVADTGNKRVQVFRLPTLELRDLWAGPFQQPIGLAADSQGRVYVLDRGLRRVLRFDAWGAPDAAYNAALAQAGVLTSPVSLAVGVDDNLYVSDGTSNTILSFTPDGLALGRLPATPGGAPAQPRALAAHGSRLYVADADDGQIWVYDTALGVPLGPVPGYRGPVAGMAVAADGTLYVRPGDTDTLYRLSPSAAHLASGALLPTGPLDAGEGSDWVRVAVTADVPTLTSVILEVFTSADPSHAPSDTEWARASLDVLLETLPPIPGSTTPRFGPRPWRYLWLRVALATSDPTVTPRLLQVEAATGLEDYLTYLPAVYAREDGAGGPLRRWLALFSAELGDVETLIEAVPRRFDPVTAADDELSRLSDWLAFEPPSNLSPDELRALLLRVHDLYTRRGTLSGLREFIHLYTGANARIFEAFHDRHVWQLADPADPNPPGSRLGFDTALAPALPDGIIVPGFDRADPALMGLRGDYYEGLDFSKWVLTCTDAAVDFDWGNNSPDPAITTTGFSIRWTGQIQPQYSEKYTFYCSLVGRVRVWIDGQQLIDSWDDVLRSLAQREESSVGISLEGGRWHSLQLEYSFQAIPFPWPIVSPTANLQLSWSSRSQPKEIVPQSRLYSVLDDTADMTPLPAPYPMSETLLVGETVVGEIEPLTTDQFGTPLFTDTAHLFTVLLPAAALPDPQQRQELQRVIDAEKPAHTDYHLCFVEPRMRVGFQARVGIDTIVAGPPDPMSMEGAVLGLDSYLGVNDDDGPAGRVSKHAILGRDTIIG